MICKKTRHTLLLSLRGRRNRDKEERDQEKRKGEQEQNLIRGYVHEINEFIVSMNLLQELWFL